MIQPIRLGLVGVGGYARQHLTTIRTLQEFGHCELKAVVDPFADRQPAALAALRAENVARYDDLAPLLARDDIDAVVIATPIHRHAPQALAALRAGKHVYLEKPPCVTLEEYSLLLAAQESSGKTCVVGFQMQTLPALHYLKRRIQEGALGELQTVWAAVRWRREDAYYNRNDWAGHWRADNQPVYDGPATNALAHVVHGACFLAGETTGDWATVRRVRGVLKKARPVESYDSCLLEAETANGTAVKLAFTHATAQHDEAGLRCAGSRGRASLTWNGQVLIEPQDGAAEELSFVHNPQFAVMLNFLEVAAGAPRRPATRMQDALPYLQMTNGAYRSSGGSSSFAPELVAREGALYRVLGQDGVLGMDEQFEQFAADPAAAPPLLANALGPWIEADAIPSHPDF